MKKRVLSILMIMAILVSSFYVKGVGNSVYAKGKSQNYHIKKGKIYNKKNKIVKKKIVTIKKKKYYADKKGKVVKNKIFKYKKAKYFAQKKGALAKSKIVTYKGKKYYAQKNYKIAIDKAVTVKGKIYYADKDGVLKYLIDKKEYDANKKTEDSKSDDKKSDSSKSENGKTDDGKLSDREQITPGAPIEYYEPLFPHNDAIDYLTPQMFGAKADGKTDNTEAFRELFNEAYKQGFDSNAGGDNPGWRHCKSIFIPAGKYVISGKIIGTFSNFTTPPMFEVSGAGREATTINYIGDDVLFDNQNVFGFTTFRDIEFAGYDSDNVLMNFKNKTNSGYAQRLQFISCSFVEWKTIINTMWSDQMLSEVTFAYCKIASCGYIEKPCKLFVLDCAQAVNWRFDFTDIEGFNGDVFYYKQGASICLIGGSVIPTSGNIFNFDLEDGSNTWTAGPNNAHHALCYGTRFELKKNKNGNKEKDSTLAISKANLHDTASIMLDCCGFSTLDNDTSQFLIFNGALNVDFRDCKGLHQMNICGNVTKNGWIMPKMTFSNCNDLDIDYLVQNSKLVNTQGANFVKNYVRVMVDNSYDFYLGNKQYIKTVDGLTECRQVVNLGEINKDSKEPDEYNFIELKNGKIVTTKPYGYVKYAEITVPENSKYGDNYPVTVSIYNDDTKVGETVINFGSNKTYKIDLNVYSDEFKIVFTHSNISAPEVAMNFELIKY